MKYTELKIITILEWNTFLQYCETSIGFHIFRKHIAFKFDYNTSECISMTELMKNYFYRMSSVA